MALLSFRGGRAQAAASIALSAVLVAIGELAFGAGYWTAASLETVAALTVALIATNVLVVAFALYARRAVQRYRILFDRVRMGVVHVGQDGRIRRANRAAAEIMASGDATQLVGRAFEEVVTVPGGRSLPFLEETGGWTGQLEISLGDVRRSVHAVLVAAGDPETGTYQVLVGDRSTEVMQKREIERQARLASLGEALARVAHELDNPLAVILGHIQLAQAEERNHWPGEAEELLEILSHEADRMRSMIRELVAFSRVEESGSEANVDEVLRRVLRVQRITLGQRIGVRAELAADAVAATSPLRIEQIVA